MIICKDKDNRINKQNKVKIICQKKNQCFSGVFEKKLLRI